MKLRIGSRGSQLALWQANHIAGLLRVEGHEVEIEIIKTTGDRLQEVTFAQVGTKGMFTKEIEEALADGRVDLAVHSLKDLPTELPEPFTLAATPVRVDPRDVFVSVKHANLAALPLGARVGTSSQRRRAQLKALRPDLDLVEFRGNVDTRLRKLAEGQVEAILLAAAGLDRLGRTDWVRERLDPKEFCPAAGQGALGIETRKDDGDDHRGGRVSRSRRYAVRCCSGARGVGCAGRRLPGADRNPLPPDSVRIVERRAKSERTMRSLPSSPALTRGATVRVYHRSVARQQRSRDAGSLGCRDADGSRRGAAACAAGDVAGGAA